MGVINLQTGRQKAVTVLGLKELQQRINAIMDRAVSQEVATLTASSGRYVLRQLDSAARGSGVPHQVLDDLFLYTRRRTAFGQRVDSIDVLVGLRKKGKKARSAAYVEWNAGRQVGGFDKTSRVRKKRGHLNIPGTRIGENLGTMWELGTTKMAARPWFRPTIQGIRGAVQATMAAGYKAILLRP